MDDLDERAERWLNTSVACLHDAQVRSLTALLRAVRDEALREAEACCEAESARFAIPNAGVNACARRIAALRGKVGA